ncbi:hypothetical protein AB0D14_18500 [Streptomyces sp. NPDC048484]|uniref:hypothetical protein n=1 Tax=Streptomyces sp. NPDC048484 TaxID=3155146 RepID=UPI00343660A9
MNEFVYSYIGVGGLGEIARGVEVEDGGAARVVLGLPMRSIRLDQVNPAPGAGLGQLEALALGADSHAP